MVLNDSKHYIPQLDSLRALAVLGVIFEHVGWKNQSVSILSAHCGTLGVNLFFVISGFLITGILLRDVIPNPQDKRGRALKMFYVRRAFRILPPYLTLLLAADLLNIPPFPEFVLWNITFTSNLLFVYWQPWAGPAAPLWTLCVEEQFYLIWPTILLTSIGNVTKVAALLIIAPSLYRLLHFGIGIGPHADMLLPGTLDFFAAGGLVSLIKSEGSLDARVSFYLCSFFLTVIGIWSISLFVEGFTFVEPSLRPAITIPLLSGIVFLTTSGAPSRIGYLLDMQALQWIGRRSYAIYLVHFPLIYGTISCLNVKKLFLPDWTLFLLILVGSIVLGVLMKTFVEDPCLRLRNRVLRYLSQNNRSTT